MTELSIGGSVTSITGEMGEQGRDGGGNGVHWHDTLSLQVIIATSVNVSSSLLIT